MLLWLFMYMFSRECMFLLAFPDDTVVKNPPENVGDSRDKGSISGLGGSPGEGNGNPFQYSCLENSMDKGTWFYGVAKSRTQLSMQAHIFITLESIPSNQIAESHGKSMCKLLRNYQTVSQGCCSIFPSQKQCIRDPVSPCPELFIRLCCWATLV